MFWNFLLLALLGVSLFLVIRFALHLMEGCLLLPREIERCWTIPLPEADPELAQETERRALLQRGYKGLLQLTALYVAILFLISWPGNLPILYPFSIIGTVLLVTVYGRAAIHYWRRHQYRVSQQ